MIWLKVILGSFVAALLPTLPTVGKLKELLSQLSFHRDRFIFGTAGLIFGDSKRRELLASLHSNLTLDHKKLMPAWRKPYASFAKLASCSNWLPEPDAPQNGKGLLFEFPFGRLNTAKGEKRLLPKEAFDEAARETFARPETRSLKDRIHLAQSCRQKLLDFPALTRKDIARQLGMTTTRLNQILRLTPGRDFSHDP